MTTPSGSHALTDTDGARPRTAGVPAKEHPILFSGPMVRAILEGRKTQTRRIVKPMPPSKEAVRAKAGDSFTIFTDHHAAPDWFRVGGSVWAVRELMGREPGWRCPFGAPGDRLWVRETWGDADHFYQDHENDEPSVIAYAADRSARYADGSVVPSYDIDTWNWETQRWRPSIFMRRWASRITLEVTGVRVERLQDITDDDAKAEGVCPAPFCEWFPPGNEHKEKFAGLWGSINGKRAPWDSNPWVWVVSFERVQ